jgi:predicted DNA-binding protein (MmcQ/YjbR family)
MATRNRLTRAKTALRDWALTYPESYEEFPWGESAIKVKGKVFLFLHVADDKLSLSLKLPVSGPAALSLPFAAPTGYGLGKSGWVTARFGADADVPLDMLREWIDESFRAVAPKRLVAALEEAEAALQKPRRRAKK